MVRRQYYTASALKPTTPYIFHLYYVPTMLQTLLLTTCALVSACVLVIAAYHAFRFVVLFVLILNPDVQLQAYKGIEIHDTVPEISKNVRWALITGSSGGIGFGFAEHLLSLNFGVIILAHIESEVVAAEERLRKQYPKGAIRSVVFNCQTASVTEIEELVQSLKEMSITMLINNVGGVPMPAPAFRSLVDMTASAINAHFDMNARFMTHLTRLLLPHLSRNAQPRSLILNVASGAREGMPLLTIYSATKAYVSSFSHALSRELKLLKEPVDCLCIVPGDVASDGNCVGLTPGSPTAGEFARCVLERVDGAVAQGRLEISPYWRHALQLGLLSFLPEFMAGPEFARIMCTKRDVWAREHQKSR
jgi:17beta-estradiol 17-dehydrogenase / very-long-chain 3-oxoacyl-CoA reductase